MTTDIGLEFVLLANGVAPVGSELATRPVGAKVSELRVGIDKDGLRHLLAPIAEPFATDGRSAALSLSSRSLMVGGGATLFADLKCSDKRLSLVFERLVADIVARVEAGVSPNVALPKALEEWRDLFRATPRTFTLEQAIGLIGELHILERLAESMGHQAALDAWWGPDGHTHDFYSTAARAIEVKSTRTLEGNRIHVSNLAQLDPADVEDLHLAVLRLKADQRAPTLDERISALLDAGFPAAELLAKVGAAGYLHESKPQFPTRFSVKTERWWSVGEDFPGLRESRLAAPGMTGVSNVRYELSLDSVGAFLSDDRVDDAIRGWCTHG